MSSLIGEEAAQLFSEHYSLLSEESDRGAVLIAASLLDVALENLVKAKLVKQKNKKDSLFDGANAPLGTFSSRIEIAFRLGLIQNSTREMLDVFRRLRNDFAHKISIKSLEDPIVKNRLNAIYEKHSDTYSVIKLAIQEMCNDSHSLENITTRNFFNIMFAMNSMALTRIQNDVERLNELLEK